MTAEEVGEDMCPVLVGYDNDSHGVWALAVDVKGATRPAVQWVKGKIDEAGCSETPFDIAIRPRRGNGGIEESRGHIQTGRDRHAGITGARFESQWGCRKSGQILGGAAQDDKTPCREENEDIHTEGFGNDDMVGIMGCRRDIQIQSSFDRQNES